MHYKNYYYYFYQKRTFLYRNKSLLSDRGNLLHSDRLRSIIFFIMICITFMPLKLSAQQLSTNKDKFLGGATSSYIYRYFDSFWNQLSPGNDGKWGSVTFTRGSYNWTNLDYLYNYATKRDILYKHHTLVWGSQQPSWIAGLDSANQRTEVENWIKLVGEKYPKMAMVDVVNEPFHTPLPSYKNALGGNGATGWDWIITAFQLARKYCASGTKLLLNEYNVLGSTQVTNDYLVVINLLKERGLIDGIGVQGHYFEFRSEINAASKYVYDIPTIKSNLNKLTATELPVYITEFDIDEQIDSNQVSQYKVYFPIFWNNPGVKGITFWGYIEDDVWTSHPYTYLLKSDGTERPALTWLRNFIACPLSPILVSPATAALTPRNPTLVWNTSNLASSYHVQVSTNSNFTSGMIIDSTVTDTLLSISSLTSRTMYFWRVSGVNSVGSGDYSSANYFVTNDIYLAVNKSVEVPAEYKLSQNYPNPFNPTTTIKFSLPVSSNVKLILLNTLGQQIKIIVNNYYEAGSHQVTLDATGLSTGVYFYKLETGKFVDVKKLVLMK